MRTKNIAAILMTLIILVTSTGCEGTRLTDVPELIEPIASVSSYRAVDKRTIGDISVLIGTVVAKEYGNFFSSGARIRKIKVNIGDYVKKGDVLAEADTDDIRKEIEQIENDREHKAILFELNKRLHMENKKLITDEANLNVEEENYNYDLRLYNYENEKTEKKLEELRSVEKSGALLANHDGYVCYVKNIADNDYALSMENVVVITDSSDTYIEIGDKSINDYPYSKYEHKYIKYNGEQIDVNEIEYTSNEQVAAGISKKYPNIRFKIPENISMTIGETCPVFFTKKKKQEEVAVCNDAVYYDEDRSYVYVLGDNSKREKRYIEIGEKDKYYSQVISGLEIGELVYYESETSIPSGNNTRTANNSTFEINNYTLTYEVKDYYTKIINTELEGVIQKICVEKKDTVKKGDLLYVIDTGKGKADLAKAQNEINRENKNYQDQMKQFTLEEKEIGNADNADNAAILKNILEIKKQIAKENHEYSLSSLQKEYDRISADNDGKGNINIYSDVNGVVSDIRIEEEQRVLVYDNILTIDVPGKKSLLVKLKDEKKLGTICDNIADFNEKVIFENDNGSITGSCIGYTVNSANNEQKCFVNTIKGKANISFNTSSGYDAPAFFVKLDKKKDYKKLAKSMARFLYIDLKGVVVIPSKSIHIEQQGIRKDCPYIWKSVDDKPVKEYVLIDDVLSNEYDTVILSGLEAGEKYIIGD